MWITCLLLTIFVFVNLGEPGFDHEDDDAVYHGAYRLDDPPQKCHRFFALTGNAFTDLPFSAWVYSCATARGGGFFPAARSFRRP
jgi:hypothetical protein